MKYNKNRLLIFPHVSLLHKEDLCVKLLQGYIYEVPVILLVLESHKVYGPATPVT